MTRRLELDGLVGPVKILCPSECMAPPTVRFVSFPRPILHKSLARIERDLAGARGSGVGKADVDWTDEHMCAMVHDVPTAAADDDYFNYAQFSVAAGVPFEPRDLVLERARRVESVLAKAAVETSNPSDGRLLLPTARYSSRAAAEVEAAPLVYTIVTPSHLLL